MPDGNTAMSTQMDYDISIERPVASRTGHAKRPWLTTRLEVHLKTRWSPGTCRHTQQSTSMMLRDKQATMCHMLAWQAYEGHICLEENVGMSILMG